MTATARESHTTSTAVGSRLTQVVRRRVDKLTRAALQVRHRSCVVLLGLSFLLCGCTEEGGSAPSTAPPGQAPPATLATTSVGLRLVVTGLVEPTFVTHAGDARLFVVEQAGRIRVVHNGRLDPVPFLDIGALVSSGGERGLLSVAFHPDYSRPGAPGEGLLWLNYTDRAGDTVLARYTASRTQPTMADPTSARVLLTIRQPFANHNGGQLQFGPVEGVERKRYLYIGMGDGGSGGDPMNHAQRDDTLLGKMLRLEPMTAALSTPPFYTIPPDNPQAGAGVLLGTIWGKGLRNPWRFSFDALTGDLYIADVGQSQWEEVHVTRAGTPAGRNYGWRILEGRACFQPPVGCDPRGLELPVLVYAQSSAPRRCAIIGGYVYRGRQFPSLQGTYFYADLCSREIWGLKETAPGLWESTLLHTAPFAPSTFGEDVNHELYISGNTGEVYQIVLE